MLDGSAVLGSGRCVQEAETVRAEQPLVGRAGEPVGLDVRDGKRRRAQRLRDVEHELRPDLSTVPADGHEVDPAAVGPVDGGQRHYGAGPANRVEHARRPVVVVRSGHGDEPRVPRPGELAPRIHVGWELPLQNDDTVPARDRDVGRGHVYPVADRGHDRHVSRLRTDQLGEHLAGPLAFIEEVRRPDLPRPGFSSQASLARLDRAARQR